MQRVRETIVAAQPRTGMAGPQLALRSLRRCLARAGLLAWLTLPVGAGPAACGAEEGAPGGAGPGSGAVGPLRASFWYSYGGRNREVLEELIARFHASQQRYRIDATFQGSYFEALGKLRTALITHEGPDVTHVIGEVLPYLWEAGVLEDLTPYTKSEQPLDMSELIPALTQDGYFDYGPRRGEIPLFALPFNRSTPIAYYDRDLFAARGLQPPTTWAELRQVAAALTERKGEQVVRWGFAVPVDWWFWVALLYQAGGALLDDSGQTPLFAGPEGRAALQLLADMARVDRTLRLPPGQDFNSWEVTNNDFLAGKVAMIWTSTAFLSYLSDNASFRVGAAPLPGQRQRGVPSGGTFFVMLRRASPAAKEAAWAFLAFMMQPEQTAYWSRRTGYLPVHRRALEVPELAELHRQDPNFTVALDQLAVARPFPFSPSLFTIQREHLQHRLDRPVLGLAGVDESLAEAAAAARQTLAVYRTACWQEQR